MSSNLEPTDVGPAVGGDLPVSQADKDQVLHLLQAAFDDGRLTFDELSTRQAEAHRAETFDDLIPLTRDLVALDKPRTYTVATASPATPPPTASSVDTEEAVNVLAVFSAATRKGRWRVPKQVVTAAVFGGVEIDLTQADFVSNVCEITAYAAFGGIEITVPDNAQVINKTMGGFMGGMDVRNPDTIDPSAPTIIVKGFAIFGGVEVRPRKKKNK